MTADFVAKIVAYLRDSYMRTHDLGQMFKRSRGPLLGSRALEQCTCWTPPLIGPEYLYMDKIPFDIQYALLNEV